MDVISENGFTSKFGETIGFNVCFPVVGSGLGISSKQPSQNRFYNTRHNLIFSSVIMICSSKTQCNTVLYLLNIIGHHLVFKQKVFNIIIVLIENLLNKYSKNPLTPC